MTAFLSDYNVYMNLVFGGNATLIAIVTGILLSGVSAVLYKLPSAISTIAHKHLLASVTVDNSCGAYNNIMDNLDREDSILSRLGHYTMYSKTWWNNSTYLGPGAGSRLMRSKVCWYLMRTRSEQLDDKLLLVSIFYVPRYRSVMFLEYIDKQSKSSADTRGTYRVAKMVDGSPKSVRQANPPSNSLVRTRGSSEVYARVDNFVNAKSRYIDNDVPYKLGLLLYGPPGVGKTSVVRHIAAEYGYDIIVIDSITDLKCLHDMKSASQYIILMEEIDSMVANASVGDAITKLVGATMLTDILKELDGVLMTPGRLLIATTNHLESLDPALLRPGRFDHLVEFYNINKDELSTFINKYYNVGATAANVIMPEGGVSPAVIQNDYISTTEKEFLSKYVDMIH